MKLVHYMIRCKTFIEALMNVHGELDYTKSMGMEKPPLKIKEITKMKILSVKHGFGLLMDHPPRMGFF